MASITITLKNDKGQVIGEQMHELGENLSHLDQIEEKVETFRKAALGEVTKELLEESQKDFQKKSIPN
jgi:hypothetical protein